MPTLHNITISIVCGNIALEEYNISRDDDNYISCYIASEANKAFAIHVEKADECTALRVGLDGDLLHWTDGRGTRRVITGANVAPHSKKTYCFRPIDPIEDNPETQTQPQDAPTKSKDQRGYIKISAYRARMVQSVPFQPIPEQTENTTAAETDATPQIHRASLGPAIHCDSTNTSHEMELLDAEPYAVFKFHYRPRARLIEKGIIPAISPVVQSSAGVPRAPISVDYDWTAQADIHEYMEDSSQRTLPSAQNAEAGPSRTTGDDDPQSDAGLSTSRRHGKRKAEGPPCDSDGYPRRRRHRAIDSPSYHPSSPAEHKVSAIPVTEPVHPVSLLSGPLRRRSLRQQQGAHYSHRHSHYNTEGSHGFDVHNHCCHPEQHGQHDYRHRDEDNQPHYPYLLGSLDRPISSYDAEEIRYDLADIRCLKAELRRLKERITMVESRLLRRYEQSRRTSN